MSKPQLRVNSSHVAGLAMGERLAKARWSWKAIALQAGALVTGLIGGTLLGGFGVGAAFLMERTKNKIVAKDQKKALVDMYRTQVAAILDMDPRKVGVADLELAAKQNKQLATAIQGVEREQASNNRINNLSAAAGAAVGWLPVAGLAHFGAHAAATVGAMVVSSAFEKDVLEVTEVTGHIDGKIVAGQPVSAADIVTLRIAQDEKLQADIKKHTGGHAFHKMNEAQQQVVMQAMPEMMAAAEYDAGLINNSTTPREQLAMLVMHSPGMQRQQQGSWANRVGGPRGARGSFVQQVQASRAALAPGGAALA